VHVQPKPRLTLLGGFELDAIEPGEPPSLPRKAKALLAFLALQPGRPQSRDKLATLLWEESGQTRARQSLRQALSALRKALPVGVSLTADSESVTLAGLDVDALLFEQLAASRVASELERAVDLYGGELLEGFDARADAFDAWLMQRRSHYRELAISVMARLLERQLAEDPSETALRLNHRLIALDPLRESAHRSLMSLYAGLGRPAEAARRYRYLRRLLWRELDAEPEPETVRLYREIMQAREGNQAPAPDRIASAPIHPVRSDPRQCDPTPSESEPEPEVRQVTLLGLSWVPADELMQLDVETLRDQAERFRNLVAEMADRYKGRVLESGPSGCTLVFGLPKARSDDPERALHAALSLQEALRTSANGSLRAALDCGQVLMAGAEDGLELSGPVLHRCSDLLRAVPVGELLVTETVYRRLHGQVEGERAVGASLPAWRIPRATPTPRIPSTPMIGRETELGVLMAGLVACTEAGVGGTLLLRGEAGIGKTRLVEEARGRAIELGFDVVLIRILDFGAAAEDPISRLVGRLVTDSPEPSPAELEQALREARGRGRLGPGAVALLGTLAGLAEQTLDRVPEAISDRIREQRLRDALTALVRESAESCPRLLIFEDIHWADPRTLDRLATLAETTSLCPLLLVMTSRIEGEPLDPGWRAAMQGASLTTLDLGPLRSDQAMRLARELAPEDETRALRCSARAEGNPLFLEQLLLCTEGDGGGVPDSVQSIVLGRLDALSAAERTALQSASVLGQRFSREDLCTLVQDPGYDARTLVERRFLRPDGGELMFVHALIREAVYGSLPGSRRRLLHRAAAERYRRTDPVLHARHLARAGAEEAAAAHRDAALYLIQSFRFDQAADLAREGLGLTRTPALVHRLSRIAGEALASAGQTAQARTFLESALASAVDDAERARILLDLSRVQALLDEPEAALESLAEAQSAARAAGEASLDADIRFQRGNVLFNLARLDDCLASHRALAEDARRSGSTRHEALAEGGLGDAYYLRGRMITAHGHFARCVELARAHGLAQLIPANLGMQAWTAFYCNRLGEAIAMAQEALRLAQERFDAYSEGIVYGILGPMLLTRGDPEQAGEIGERSRNLARRLGSPRYLADSLWILGEVHGVLGDRERAVRYAREALGALGEVGLPYAGAVILGILARFSTDPAERRDCIARGEQLLTRGTMSHNVLQFHQCAIEAWLEERNWGRVEQHAQALADYTREEPLPWSEFYLRRGRALAAAGRGRRDEGVERDLVRSG
jgi:DNA-binding SARP family transcriptional activator